MNKKLKIKNIYPLRLNKQNTLEILPTVPFFLEYRYYLYKNHKLLSYFTDKVMENAFTSCFVSINEIQNSHGRNKVFFKKIVLRKLSFYQNIRDFLIENQFSIVYDEFLQFLSV